MIESGCDYDWKSLLDSDRIQEKYRDIFFFQILRPALLVRFVHKKKMNYAKALKSGLMTEFIVNSIQSQSMEELGRELTSEEKSLLFKHIPPSALLEQINKVRIILHCLNYFTFILVWSWCNQICFDGG